MSSREELVRRLASVRERANALRCALVHPTNQMLTEAEREGIEVALAEAEAMIRQLEADLRSS